MSSEQSNASDERWGGHIPWFLRHQDFSGSGNFSILFERLSQRFDRLFRFNEAGIQNLDHFGARLESESLQRFKHNPKKYFPEEIRDFFNPQSIQHQARMRSFKDPEELSVLASLTRISPGLVESKQQNRGKKGEDSLLEVERATRLADDTRAKRIQYHYQCIIREKLAVLEDMLHILPNQSAWFLQLKRDIRRNFEESEIMLDIKGDPPLIVPLDERLLQREVIDKLLPRLEARFPERAKEIVKAYHDSISGKKLDEVFSGAFKTLEEIARSITGDDSFMFDAVHLNKHFPDLHPTIHETMKKLSGHRGDKAGHARSAPDPHEIRYLLFAICNIALLLLDYPDENASES